MCRGLEASSFVICNMRAYPLRGLSIANKIMYLLVPVFVGHWWEIQKVGLFWEELWTMSIDGTRFLGRSIGRGMIYLLTHLWFINESVVGQTLSRRMEG
jgi:hypothetical protein